MGRRISLIHLSQISLVVPTVLVQLNGIKYSSVLLYIKLTKKVKFDLVAFPRTLIDQVNPPGA